jgi:hypothetical protein
MPNQTAAGNDPARTPPRWPADVPSEVDAEGILCAAFGGLKAAGDPALEAALVALTALEKGALDGVPQGIDPVPLRRAATLRYRIETALATAPAAGAPIDLDAGRALLAAVDDVLAAMTSLGASPRAAEADAIRRALVKEAVDLSELLQRLAPRHGAPAPAASGAAIAPSRSSVARVLATDAIAEGQVARRSRRAWIALAVVTVLGGGFHAYRWAARPPPPKLPTLAGLPEQALGFEKPGGGRMIVSKDGAPLTAGELAAFRRAEEAAGRVIREVAPGIFVSAPPSLQGSTP